jgi:hypothetical protein
MGEYSVPSPDELPSNSEFKRTILPGNEDYVVRVLELDAKTKPDFDGIPREVFVAKMAVVSFADGAPLEDIDGNKVPEADEIWLWKDLDLSRMGFRKDGTASISRQFFLAINGISDMNERIPKGETSELIGKTVIATLIVAKGRDGNNKNNITGFKTPGRRRRSQPAIDPAYAEALGDLVEGAVVTEEVAQDATNYDDLPF